MRMAVVVAVVTVAYAAANRTALAADLGGACCADLEERIAELEATAARKGNRKVSLTISGYVAQEMTYWDDGGEQNIYIHGLGPTQTSHVKFNGQAIIAPGWTAGYMLRLQDLSANPFGRSPAGGMNQDTPNFSNGLTVQMTNWYLQNKELGKVSVGLQANAAKSAAMFTDQSGTQIIDNYTFLAGFPQFFLRSAGNLSPPVTWGQLAYCYGQNLPLGGDCNGIVMRAVRYDTAVIGGFSASASWGEDDVWEVAARYAGEAAGFKLAFGIGYSETSDEIRTGPRPVLDKNTDVFQIGGYAQHLATGLFLHAAYGHEDNNGAIALRDIDGDGIGDPEAQIGPVKDSEHWYVKAGIRRNWTSLGATVLSASYAEYLDQLGPGALAQGATSSELKRYGALLAQEIDPAATTVYLKYQQLEADVDGAPLLTDLHDLKLFSLGAVVNF
jgi:predicted porin